MSSSRRSANAAAAAAASANSGNTPDLKDVYDPQVSPANYLSNPGSGAVINGGTDDATGLSFGGHQQGQLSQQQQQQHPYYSNELQQRAELQRRQQQLQQQQQQLQQFQQQQREFAQAQAQVQAQARAQAQAQARAQAQAQQFQQLHQQQHQQQHHGIQLSANQNVSVPSQASPVSSTIPDELNTGEDLRSKYVENEMIKTFSSKADLVKYVKLVLGPEDHCRIVINSSKPKAVYFQCERSGSFRTTVKNPQKRQRIAYTKRNKCTYRLVANVYTSEKGGGNGGSKKVKTEDTFDENGNIVKQEGSNSSSGGGGEDSGEAENLWILRMINPQHNHPPDPPNKKKRQKEARTLVEKPVNKHPQAKQLDGPHSTGSSTSSSAGGGNSLGFSKSKQGQNFQQNSHHLPPQFQQQQHQHQHQSQNQDLDHALSNIAGAANYNDLIGHLSQNLPPQQQQGSRLRRSQQQHPDASVYAALEAANNNPAASNSNAASIAAAAAAAAAVALNVQGGGSGGSGGNGANGAATNANQGSQGDLDLSQIDPNVDPSVQAHDQSHHHHLRRGGYL